MRLDVTCALPTLRKAANTSWLIGLVLRAWRGGRFFSCTVSVPTFTVRLGPSVSYTARAGTCSDRLNRLAAIASEGCTRAPSRRARA
jgi:hypothetical protein